MELKRMIKLALREDIGKGDITTLRIVSPETKGRAIIISKAKGIIAGGKVGEAVFKELDPKIKFTQIISDGTKFNSNEKLFEIEGKLNAILTGERVALNFLQHLSGIATLTNKFVEKVRGTKVKILDTRKTTPGLRELEKYAVQCGGGKNHRMGLWDMVLIKDNHIKVAGGIEKAISKFSSFTQSLIEIEVKDIRDLKKALRYPINWIMLDNMSISEIKESVEIIKTKDPRIRIEVSGGVKLSNVREIAETGVDYISVGALTHSAPAIDMSLKVI
jgi:nicotinate-nucleotide pyrophosphorylase (carboxylating)